MARRPQEVVIRRFVGSLEIRTHGSDRPSRCLATPYDRLCPGEGTTMTDIAMDPARDQVDTTDPGTTTNDHPVPIGIDAPIFEVMASMRAMRRLRPDPVPDELLRQIIEAAHWAPSASHQQRYAFVVVTDRDVMARLAPIWRAVTRLYVRTFSQRPDDMDRETYRRTFDAVDHQASHFVETPALIVSCYDFGSYPSAVRKTDAPVARRIPAARRSPQVGVRSKPRCLLESLRSCLDLPRRPEPAARSAVTRACRQHHDTASDRRGRGQADPRQSRGAFTRTRSSRSVGRWGHSGPVRRHPVDQMIQRDRW